MTTVLVVDDEDIVRRALVHTLERNDFTCLSARDTAEATRLIETDRPDAVLLNASLGKESGLDLHRRVSASKRRPPVVFITGRRDLFADMAALLGPADDWIGKPWDPSELVSRLRLAILRADRV